MIGARLELTDLHAIDACKLQFQAEFNLSTGRCGVRNIHRPNELGFSIYGAAKVDCLTKVRKGN